MVEAVIKCLIAYLLGNLMGGQLIGVLRGGVDLRTVGSGNVGATNALRTQGVGFALGVLAIDALKGAVAAAVLPHIPWFSESAALPRFWLAYFCGFGVVLGHCYPFTLGFKGGKGVATLAGVFAALMPLALLWMLGVFALTVMLSGYVSLATLLAAATAILVVVLGGYGLDSARGVFVVAVTLLVAFKHRENMLRLLRGKESRFEKARVMGRWLAR